MAGEYRVPKRRQPVFKIVGGIFRLFLGCKVVNTTDTPLPKQAIIISNHNAKSGPMAIEVSFPMFNVKWGAGEMFGGFSSRYNYLRNILYIQKLGKGKLSATLRACFEAIFSPMLYKGMKFIPTFTDMRFLHTVKCSEAVLDAGESVLIFPEDSSKGYLDEITKALPGFVMLAELYNKKKDCDIPILPLYYHKRTRRILVGEAFSEKTLCEQGLTREEIAEVGRQRINGLYNAYCKSPEEKQE